MTLNRLAYRIYGFGRAIIRSAGLVKPVRRIIGPLTGRLVYRLSSGGDQPLDILGHKMVLASPGDFPPMDMALVRYELGTTRLWQQQVKPGMVVADIGAHVGYYTLLAAEKVGPTGKVYAFEPSSKNYALLQENIRRNGYENVVAVNKAVTHQTGSSQLYLTSLDNGRHSTYQQDLPTGGTENVETTSLDAFLAQEGRPKIDFIKVDVEGAEQDVFNGMTELLEGEEPPRLIVEFNPVLLQAAGVDPFVFLDLPGSLGFQMFYIDDERGPVALDASNSAELAERLITSEGSVNLFCVKP